MDTVSKRTLRIMLGDRAVAYHPYLARVMGSVSGGVWLSQILYWDSVKASMQDDDDADNWFYKTDAEIIGETCLTKREVQEAKSKARKLNIVKTELRGMPAKTYYLVDVDALESAVSQLSQCRATSCHNGGKLVGTDSLVKLTPDYTESTTEITGDSVESPTLSSEPEKPTPPIDEGIQFEEHAPEPKQTKAQHLENIRKAVEENAKTGGKPEIADAHKASKKEHQRAIDDLATRLVGVLHQEDVPLSAVASSIRDTASYLAEKKLTDIGNGVMTLEQVNQTLTHFRNGGYAEIFPQLEKKKKIKDKLWVIVDEIDHRVNLGTQHGGTDNTLEFLRARN